MTNAIESFEFELKKQSTKTPKTLYNSNKQQNTTIYKPQDVISSVSLQMKAIQVADSLKSGKCDKKLNQLKKSTFLSVNNLPAYEEVAKQTMKFDTQFATDTQLINVIEDAELIDAHAGMTEEFDSSFRQAETEDQRDIEEDSRRMKDAESANEALNVNRNDKIASLLQNSIKNDTGIKNDDRVTAMEFKNDVLIIRNKRKLDTDDDDLIDLFDKNDENKGFKHATDEHTQFEEYSQMLNQCIEIEDEDIERPLSPIFMQKSKPKSKPSTPLVVSLETFEKFEQIAMPIVESNDINTAKHVINSQILDNELLIKVNEVLPPDKEKLTNDVNLKFQIDETDDNGKEIKSLIVEDPDLDIQFLELDKEISEDLIKKAKTENTEILKDEILFSSDEEEFVQKSYQDLPFTCALATSFYNVKDMDETMFVGFQTASNKSIQVFTESFVQAKSLLSNVSERDDDITVTDLVNNCDGNVKSKDVKMDFIDKETELDLECNDDANDNKELCCEEKEVDLVCTNDATKCEGHRNIDFNGKATRLDSACNDDDANMLDVQRKADLIDRETEIGLACNIQAVDNMDIDVVIERPVIITKHEIEIKSVSNSNFQGFKTASNKNIKLSEKALARCNKVFQNIDLNEDFGSQTEEIPKKENKNLINEIINKDEFETINEPETKIMKNHTNDIQSIDDVIIQEFENIEMSLEEDGGIRKVETENVVGIKNETDDNALEKYQDYVKDIDFDNDFTQVDTNDELSENITEIKTLNERTADAKTAEVIEITSIDTIIDNINSNKPSTSKSFIGFKTANHKNIKISKQALAKTKSIFKNIDSTEPKSLEKLNIEEYNTNMDKNNIFEGFKTASNRNIIITKEALAKTANIFKDLDSDIIIPEKYEKEDINENIELSAKQPSTSKEFLGFKTANNKKITISDAALAKTIDIFKEIDVDCKKDNNFNESSTDLPNFVGFKTANNKSIKISETALVKTKNIFKNLDTEDFDFPSKNNEESLKSQKGLTNKFSNDKKKIKKPYPVEDLDRNKDLNKSLQTIDFNESFTNKARFVGFKTANNKNINISETSIAKTKNIFKDIDDNVASSKTEEEINKNVANVEIFEEIDDVPPPLGFIGFKTGHNKEIKVLKAALAKTKNIFKDLNQIKENKSEKDYYPTIIKDVLEANTKINYNEVKSIENTVKEISIPKFQGFTTASNKKVKISEEALIKSKNIFKDTDQYEIKIKEKDDYPTIEKDRENKRKDSPLSFQGFTTASNKKVKISKQALLKSKNIFKDIESDPNTDVINDPTDKYEHEDREIAKGIENPPKFQGFTTASNRKVNISKEALLKTKKIFKDIDNDPNTDFNNDLTNKFEKDGERVTKNDLSDGIDIKNSRSSPIFEGFKTASKKTVSVSKEAIAKSKELFLEIKEPEFLGFKTASNNKVKISEKALKETRKIFDDEILSFKFDKKHHLIEDFSAEMKIQDNDSTKFIKKRNLDIGVKENTDNGAIRNKRCFSEIDTSEINKEKIIVNEILDTQILNDFEESLHTEDFNKTAVTSKRSGSPILSCPKAKKRKKFVTPYSQKQPKCFKTVEKINKNVTGINFTEDYKKNKCFTLKDLQKLKQTNSVTTDPYILKFNFENLLKFEFINERNNLTDSKLNLHLFKDLFTNSVNNKLIPNGWLDNHFKLILWKLISYEVKFNLKFNARNVMDQLKFRYDKELYNAQRPVLRKILEKDDVPSKTMVLCVAGVYVDGVSVASASTTNLELLLTDGWYCIMSTPDKMLAQLVCDGKITVGTKIVTNGAELVNCEQGVSPWEDTSAVRLKIFGNSTRRARWDARLGYHGNGAILSQLSAVKLDGGKVSKLMVFVTRVYPAMYVEKFEDGSTVTRSERLEHLHQMKTEAERQGIMEKLYEEVEKEFADQESQDSEGYTDSCNRTCLDSGSQIAKLMKNSRDPAEFRAHLTSSQTRLLEAHTTKRREHLLEDIQKRIRKKMETAGVNVNRNVVTLLKIRVAGVEDREKIVVTKGMMSIWKPTEEVQEIIKEGAWIDIMNVVPTAVRYSEIQISAGRQSIFSASKYKDVEKIKPYTSLLKRKCYTIKDLAQNPAMATDYNEIDTVGMIFQIDPSISDFDSTKQPFQNVYLADFDKNIICINFWGGLKKFGFHNVLDTGQIVSCVNLQKRAGNTRKTIPHFRVTEFSYFTKTPKSENARTIVDDLNKMFLSLDRRKFCEQCIEIKNNYSSNKNNAENISPYRFNNSDYNQSRNKIFIDSPLARPKTDDNFNLTGLDFESTFRQTDTQNLSEEVLIRKRKVNEKIAKLKMYGEPPPLTNLHIINKSKSASNSYKSPLLTKNNQSKTTHELSNSKSDSCVNVANEKNSPENVGDSPVILNRTYVKSIDPVKIDFDVKDDSHVDHFADDFDGSPPLSLD
ncbi:breast cancer type 2 susceptibility protein homolog [Trichoplusia ni]|uniref:Breast cancer type 2 susceptibility protein homolog n=1 Tax=Trichoplusia ni TaxID=7111 RepID=A0A7E5W2F4_TRINI|nr:breast cancer type 2 susceptibility protein homolog [Trichoplusia ni]